MAGWRRLSLGSQRGTPVQYASYPGPSLRRGDGSSESTTNRWKHAATTAA